jgi:cytochrome c peroxidase
MSLAACYLAGGRQATTTPEEKIAQTLVRQLDDFSRLINVNFRQAAETGAGQQRLQQLFLEARSKYKKFEWAAEYFDPLVARSINGPPVPDIDPAALVALDPDGLQLMEGLLFPVYKSSDKDELIIRLNNLLVNTNKLRIHFNSEAPQNWQVFDAAKLEIFRILTLGITGFDAPVSQNSMTEAANSLQSLKVVLSYYPGSEDLLNEFQEASDYLTRNSDFDRFDRAGFIVNYGNKISTDITGLAGKLNMPVVTYNRLLRQDAKTLFDVDAFDVNAYASGPEYVATDQKISLGKKLFSDPVLSGAQTRSCQSCHQPDKAFTDNLIRNTEIGSNTLLSRNTPTLFNAALQPSLFYDSRALTLEDQVRDVVQNDKEMHGSLSKAVKLLWHDKNYKKLFSEAYPIENRSSIDTMEVMNAIASYVRSLTLLNSRFDEYMRGYKSALNKQELHGFNIFMGKARCASCHYMPLFNGTVPPRYIRIEGEVIGVPGSTKYEAIDADDGQFAITPFAFLKHAFKTTTVRDASRTAPYMHNGVFKNLEELVDFYNDGGGVGKGLKIPNQTLSADSLHLQQDEKNDLIAFIKSLDSR